MMKIMISILQFVNRPIVCDNCIIQSLNHICYHLNGCKSKKKTLKRLDMLERKMNLEKLFYEEKELQDIMIEFYLTK